ncbi:hypothetical protein LG315_05100 [Microbacterium marinum]|uniref:hypothetical protein n=1 Tax=Microbacterium marinum TaxID=421115 RepID=UPI00385160F0
MSTPDQPSPPLTRRQLRELRNTASTPIITQEEADEAAAAAATAETEAHDVPVEEVPESTPSTAVEAEPEPTVDEEHPSDSDGDARPISRKQARAQAKLRTAAIELVPHDESDRHHDDVAAVEAEPVVEPEPEVDDESQPEPVADVEPEAEAADDAADDDAADEDPAVAAEPKTDDEAESTEKAPVVAPGLGAQLLSGEPGDVELPASFDHLLARGGGGSSSAPNALILSQTPETGSLSVPIMGTGELLITGSYSLPQNYGSTGAVPGSQDGKDLDAALIDGELPPASSPTPIAASSAISTIKSADEIIRPPVPEKGSRLMMTLAITAGALALALATVLILAVVNGVF